MLTTNQFKVGKNFPTFLLETREGTVRLLIFYGAID